MNMLEYLKNITDLSPYIGTEPFCGVRYNPLTLTQERFEKIAPVDLAPCEFHHEGYRVMGNITGTHPLHMAGGFYIQEPSAMSAVTALKLKSSDKVLDMCAAPGSKTTAIAPHCDLLVANEVNASRAKVLIGNIERMGISNALITNSDSGKIGNAYEGFFDKVLVDSPCSGEGMFRRHPEILQNWTPELVRMCAVRSREILQNAAKAVAPGGRLVYSTCTYNLEENERVILDFLEHNPNFEVTDTGFNFGEPGFEGLSLARRIFIKNGGEGHFVCALSRKNGSVRRQKPLKGTDKLEFLDNIISLPLTFHSGHGFTVIEHEGTKYAVHNNMPNPDGVRIMRAGVKLGTQLSKLFKPDHHLFTSAKLSCFQSTDVDFEFANRFMRGQELSVDVHLTGYCAVCFEGLAIGFGKASGGMLKNHYPKGLRIQ